MNFLTPLAQQAWIRCGLLGLLTLGWTAAGAEWLEDLGDPRNTGWFVRLGGRALFNVKTSVTRAQPEPAVSVGVYDDGFVLPDIGGTQSGLTWYWGYENESQLAGDQVRMSLLRGIPMAGLFREEPNDPSLGGEILGGMELTRFYIGRREVRFGFEIGYGYNAFSLKHRDSASSIATLTAAAYRLADAAAPTAPYAGTFEGPGPLIDLQPSISGSLSSSSQANFSGDLDSDLHNFKAGFWLEYPFTRRLTASLSLGYSSIYGDTQLHFTQTIAYDHPAFIDPDPSTKTVGGRDWKAGAYVQLRLQYKFGRHVGAYVGGDFAHHGDLQFVGENRKVTMDFGTLYSGSVGMLFEF